ncbi:hypothetical protein [Halomonas sp. WWR20]
MKRALSCTDTLMLGQDTRDDTPQETLMPLRTTGTCAPADPLRKPLIGDVSYAPSPARLGTATTASRQRRNLLARLSMQW